MSTLNVNRIVDASGGVFAPVSSVHKNRIINGDCRIDQRNAGASVTPTNGAYTIDRWQFQVSQTSKLTVQQNAGSVTPPAGFKTYLGVTSSSAYSVLTGDYFILNQYIEGFNFADMGFGAAGASTVTLSFWVRSSLTGTFAGSLFNNAFNRSYPFTYTISAANTWEQKSVTIAGDTTGTWIGAANTSGVGVTFSLGTGTTYSGTAGAWAGSGLFSATGATSVVGTNGATFYITGVQLEKGTQATSFEYRQYGQELALCQRYYYISSQSGTNDNVYGVLNSDNAVGTTSFPIPMRTIPSITIRNGTTSNQFGIIGGSTVAIRGIGGLTTDRFRTVNPDPANAITGGFPWIEFNFIASAEL